MLMRAIRLSLSQLADPQTLRVMAMVVAVTLAIIAAAGVALWQALLHIALPHAQRLTGAEWIGADDAAGLALLLTLFGGWFLFRGVAMAVAGLFTDGIVASVEEDHYPDAFARAVRVPLGTEIRLALRSLGRAVGWNLLAAPFYVLLLVTGVGTLALVILVNALVLSRDLEAMVAARHPALGTHPLDRRQRWQMGLVASVAMVIPVANLFAPVFAAALAVHMLHMPEEG